MKFDQDSNILKLLVDETYRLNECKLNEAATHESKFNQGKVLSYIDNFLLDNALEYFEIENFSDFIRLNFGGEIVDLPKSLNVFKDNSELAILRKKSDEDLLLEILKAKSYLPLDAEALIFFLEAGQSRLIIINNENDLEKTRSYFEQMQFESARLRAA